MNKQNNKRKTLLLILLACFFIFFTFSVCFSANSVTIDSNLSIGISDILNSQPVKFLMGFILTIVQPVAAIAIGINLFGMIFTKSDKQSEICLRNIKAIFIAFLVFQGLYFIFYSFGMLIGEHAYQF